MIEPTPQELGATLAAHAARLGNREWVLDAEDATPDPPLAELPDPDPEIPLAEAAVEPEIPPAPLQIIEAMLFVGGQPLSAARAVESIRGLEMEQFREAIDLLNRVYRLQNRPYTIASNEQGYTLVLRPRFRGLKERLYGGPREARLTQAALDVLSLVAYRQPILKNELDSIRGNESGTILRQLIRLGLISVVQRAESSKREVSYGTTARFLELFNLKSLDDLPQTGDPQRL